MEMERWVAVTDRDAHPCRSWHWKPDLNDQAPFSEPVVAVEDGEGYDNTKIESCGTGTAIPLHGRVPSPDTQTTCHSPSLSDF